MIEKRLFKWVGLLLPILVSACATVPEKTPPVVHDLNDGNFAQQVYNQQGPVLVYFSEYYDKPNIMKSQFVRLFHSYSADAGFAKVDASSVQSIGQYSITELPTINYYYDGILFDQVVGYPVDQNDRVQWGKDIELWIRETVLISPGAERQFSYLFRGGSSLKFYPYGF